MNKEEFIIKYKISKESKKIFLYMVPLLIIIFSFFLNFLYSLTKVQLPFIWKNIFIFSFLNFLLKIVAFGLIAFIIVTIFVVLYSIISIKKDNVIAVVTEEGVRGKYFRFIPWEYVDRIETYQAKYSPMAPTQIALWIKPDKEIRKYLSIGTKMGIFWSKITGYQHITFGSMDSEENLRILEFAQECLKKH